MIRDQDIVCISSIDWDFIWQGHQQIMSAFAAGGNRVLFVENTGVRPPGVRDFGRIRHRIANWWRGTNGFREERPNLFVYSPILLPFPYSWVARRVNRFIVARALRRWMRAARFRPSVTWTFLPTPFARDLIAQLGAPVTVYYCIDDFAASSPRVARIRRSEAEMFREADLVFVTSAALRERAQQFSRAVHLFPFGVDFRAFEQVRLSPDGVPADLARLARPIVGYVGGLHRWVDQEMLAETARRLPQFTFAMVGPVQTDVSRLSACPNVVQLGARPHADVPRYIKGFDVGIIPYRRSPYTDNVYPTKLNEYLAMGLPVVATDLPEIRRFNDAYGSSVAVAQSADAFADAIATAVERMGLSADKRIEIARANGWEARIEEMSGLVSAALSERQAGAGSWQDRLRRLYRSSRRRGFEAAGLVVGLYLLLFYTNVVWSVVAQPLFVDAPPRQAEAIVVLAGGVGESGKAGGGYQERVKQAIDLYRAGYAPRMIFSSGYVFAFREAEVMKELAEANGVPGEAILLETNAANTYQNVRYVADLLRQQGWHRVLLVSSPYHMERVTLTWRRWAPDLEMVPVPVSVQHSQFYAHDRGATLEQIGGIVHEYLAIAEYWRRGWI